MKNYNIKENLQYIYLGLAIYACVVLSLIYAVLVEE